MHILLTKSVICKLSPQNKNYDLQTSLEAWLCKMKNKNKNSDHIFPILNYPEGDLQRECFD